MTNGSPSVRITPEPTIEEAAAIAAAIEITRPRIMVGQGHQAHHDFALALVHFLRQHPELAETYGELACRRAAGRAWKYARRAAGLGWTSRYPWLNLQSYVRPPRDAAAFIEKTMPVYHLGAGPAAKPIIRVPRRP